MIVRFAHPVRALIGAAAAVLLAAAPFAALAQEKPQPLNVPSEVQPAPPAAPQTQPQTPSASTVGSVIRPGDTLAIAVYGHSDLTQTAVVQADGTIQYPLVQRVFVGGMSAAEARDALAKALLKYLKHPIVSLAVQQQGAISVTILGNVKIPGKYQMRNGSHLIDAIAASSGVANQNGDYPDARVSEPDGDLKTVSLQKLLHDGDSTQNVELADNTLIYVTGGETFRVQVLGAVTRPGNVEVTEGERLSMALARAGLETAAKPDLNRVFLTRFEPSQGKNVSYEVNVYQALQQGKIQYDPILRKDDKILVPEAHTVSPALIGVLGALGRLLGF
ncbi:MAG TPA: polysaccharide biosynthesis/export family protein [Candidatus Elarobacter sp.]|jgi:protein involved in polysaccharide export with SLBB domain|nr:polysaccharide biosynthesis/export family protein [Candidatus Elarobacter sp.]